LAASFDSESDSDTEFDPDGEIVDEEDEYDPRIDVNVVFPEVDQFKLAVTHHAISHDHAFPYLAKRQDKI
jgi:hypothetical protein